MNQKTKQALVKTGYQFTAVIIAVILVLFMRSITHGQEIKVRSLTTKPAGVKSLSAPEASADSSITWEILEPAEKKCLISKDGRTVAFFMDDDARVIILCDVIDWANKKHYKTKTIVNADGPVPPGPEPPDPKPLLHQIQWFHLVDLLVTCLSRRSKSTDLRIA